MDRSVRWSVDPVRWTGPRTGGQLSVFGSPASVGAFPGVDLHRISLTSECLASFFFFNF